MPGHIARRLATSQHALDELLACDAIFVCVLATWRVVPLRLFLLLDQLSLTLCLVRLVDRERIAVYIVARFLDEWMEVAVLLIGIIG